MVQTSRSVTTLALGSRPRQGLARMRAKREVRECGRVRGWTLTLPSELPFWELESWWIPEFLEINYKGQNPSPWGVLYIIGKLLKCRCLKWVRMTHLESETQVMIKRKVRSQIGSLIPDHEKLGIDLISWSKVCTRSYSPTKLQEFQPWRFWDSHLGVPGQKVIWMRAPRRGEKYTICEKVVASFESRPWWILWVWGRSWLILAPRVLQLCTNHLVLVL
jgi:hypothetical protein